MPEYIRPRRAIIETGGSGRLAALAGVVAVLLAVAAVVSWILAHLVVLAIGLGVIGMVEIAAVQFLKRYMVVAHDVHTLPQPVAPIAVQRAVLDPPRRALPPPVVHHHLHLHGLAAEDIAAVISRQESPARPAIEEDQ